jgi:hypothetical protein
VLPTLARRLESGWSRAAPPPTAREDLIVRDSPLPDFIPKALFSDLSLPEVAIHVPGQSDPTNERVLQAMREFAPGKVSYRYALRGRWTRLWVDAPADGSLDLSQFCPSYDELGEFVYQDSNDKTTTVRTIRPWSFSPVVPPDGVQDYSNSRLRWHTEILPEGEPVHGDVPDPSAWTDLVTDVAFFVQNRRSHAVVRRFAPGADAEVSQIPGGTSRRTIAFVDNGGPAALGFVLDVDGLVVRCRVPETIEAFGLTDGVDQLRSLRTAYFAHCLQADPTLEQFANVFQRDWIIELYLSALVAHALEQNCDLEQAARSLEREGLRAVIDVLDVIFQALADADVDPETGTAIEEERSKLQQSLESLLDEPTIAAALDRHARVLWEPPDELWTPWLQDRYLTTLGAALIEAVQALCPEFDADDLVLDTDPGPTRNRSLDDGQRELWITETIVGGGGLVEELLVRYAEDPRRFFNLVEHLLGPSDFELVDSELTKYLDCVDAVPEVADAAAEVRRSRRHDRLTAAWTQLRTAMVDRGIHLSHAVTTALSTRLLRPGSSPEVDEAVRGIVDRWHEQEDRLGIEIDARVFAYHESNDEDVAKLLQQVVAGDGSADERQWRFGALLSLLWPRGRAVRADALATWNPYADLPDTDRFLVLGQLPTTSESVDVADLNWRSRVDDALRRTGSVVLRSEDSDRERLRAASVAVLSQPIHLDFLEVNPRIAGMRRTGRGLELDLELAEAVQ